MFDDSKDLLEKEQQERLKQAYSKKQFSRKIIDIYPNKRFVSEDYFVQQEYNLFDIYRINSFNLQGIPDDELQLLTSSYELLSVLYTQPFKIISISTPLKLSEQIYYTKQLINRADNDTRRLELQKRLQTLLILEAHRQQKAFYIFLYGYNEVVLRQNIADFHRSKGFLEVQPLQKQEKLNLLNQMSNLGLKTDWKG